MIGVVPAIAVQATPGERTISREGCNRDAPHRTGRRLKVETSPALAPRCLPRACQTLPHVWQGLVRPRRMANSPHPLEAVGVEGGVAADESQLLRFALRDQQAVEGPIRRGTSRLSTGRRDPAVGVMAIGDRNDPVSTRVQTSIAPTPCSLRPATGATMGFPNCAGQT